MKALSDLGQAALALAAEGASVFPLLPGDKRPWHKDVGDGHCKVCKHSHARGLRDATMRPEAINEWWTVHPEANIGLATGVRGGVGAIDIDTRHGGQASLSRLFQEHGAFPETTLARTQGDGWHYLFLLPKGRTLGNTASKIAPGIDTRGENGYIVAAPSRILREDGSVGTYEWIKLVEPAPFPEWLLKLLPEKRDRPNKGDHGSGQGLADHFFRLAKLPEAPAADRAKASARAAELVEIIRTAPPGQSFATTSTAVLEIGRMIARRQITSEAGDVYEAAFDACEERAGCEPDHVVTNGILYALENTEATLAEARAGIGDVWDVAIARGLSKWWRVHQRPVTQDEQIAESNLSGAELRLDQGRLRLAEIERTIAQHEAVLNTPAAMPEAKATAQARLGEPRTRDANLYAERDRLKKSVVQDEGKVPELEAKVKAAQVEADAKAAAAEPVEPTPKEKLAAELRNKAEAEADLLAKMKAAKTSTIRSTLEERVNKGVPAGETRESIKAAVCVEVDAEMRAQKAKASRADADAKNAEREVEAEKRITSDEIFLIRDTDGNPRRVSENIIEILRKDPRFADLKYDQFGDRLFLGEHVVEAHEMFMTNADLQREYGLTSESDLFERATLMYGMSERSYHPVKTYLSGLPAWDGVPRLLDLTRLGFGARNPYYETSNGEAESDADDDLGQDFDNYHSEVGTKLLLSGVARIMNPGKHGVKVDTVVTLIAQQGTKKSTALAALCPDPTWFSDTALDLQSKDSYIQLNGILIYEWAEIDGMNKHDASHVKRFLTSKVDKYRPPYARSTVSRPRQTVIVASVNKFEFINDPTGGRRFVPVIVGRANPKWIEERRDQLWAEALYLYRLHEANPDDPRGHWWYEGASAERLKRMVEPHIIETSLDAAVKEWLACPMFVPPNPAEIRAAKEAAGEKVGLFSGAGSVGVGLVPYKAIAKKPDAGLHFTIKEIEAALNTNEILKGSRGVDTSRIKQVLARLGFEGPVGKATKWSGARGSSSSWWMAKRRAGETS